MKCLIVKNKGRMHEAVSYPELQCSDLVSGSPENTTQQLNIQKKLMDDITNYNCRNIIEQFIVG